MTGPTGVSGVGGPTGVSGAASTVTGPTGPTGPAEIVYVKGGTNAAVNDTNDVTIATCDVTSVSAGDILKVDAWLTILNNSAATRVYVFTLDFDGLFDVELSSGASVQSATVENWFRVQGVCDVRANNLAYGMMALDLQIAATTLASGTDTAGAATHLQAKGWGTSTSDATGTLTVALKVRSADATATQTCRLHYFTVTKVTPT